MVRRGYARTRQNRKGEVMTRAQFEKSVITEIRAMMQRNSKQGEAVQVCSAGEWPSLEVQQLYWIEKDVAEDKTLTEHKERTSNCCENCTEIDKRILE